MKQAKTRKRNNVLLILLISLAVTGVFFALNDYFAWLTFFKNGATQYLGAGYIDGWLTPSYAEGKNPVADKYEYLYLPGDDLCAPDVLGLNISYKYITPDGCDCALRFSVQYRTGVNNNGAYSTAYDATERNDSVGGGKNSLILAKFSSDFNYGGMDSGINYWYYKTNGEVLAAAPDPGATINDILEKLELVGDNIFNAQPGHTATGPIEIVITAYIRQHEQGVITWSNYDVSSFNITLP